MGKIKGRGPVAKELGPIDIRREAKGGGSVLTHPKILIAEEQAGLARLLDLLIRQKGFRTDIAGSGQQAIELARDEHPDLIVLDSMMLAPGGGTLLDQLREDQETREIPMVVLTTEETIDDLPGDGLAFLTKPFEPRGLQSLIESVLLSHRSPV